MEDLELHQKTFVNSRSRRVARRFYDTSQVPIIIYARSVCVSLAVPGQSKKQKLTAGRVFFYDAQHWPRGRKNVFYENTRASVA
jgi:hypothetical protein